MKAFVAWWLLCEVVTATQKLLMAGSPVTLPHAPAFDAFDHDFELLIDVTPQANHTNLSYAPMYVTDDPTGRGVRGFSIGHGFSAKSLEVRLCDGKSLSTFVFRHGLMEPSERQVRKLRVQRHRSGRNVTLEVNNHTRMSRFFPGVSGSFYNQSGITFGRVADWTFHGTLNALTLTRLDVVENAVVPKESNQFVALRGVAWRQSPNLDDRSGGGIREGSVVTSIDTVPGWIQVEKMAWLPTHNGEDLFLQPLAHSKPSHDSPTSTGGNAQTLHTRSHTETTTTNVGDQDLHASTRTPMQIEGFETHLDSNARLDSVLMSMPSVNGRVSNGRVSNGSVSNGSVSNGSVSNGSANGTAKDSPNHSPNDNDSAKTSADLSVNTGANPGTNSLDFASQSRLDTQPHAHSHTPGVKTDIGHDFDTHWTMHFDPHHGRYYYHNSKTSETTWERPASFHRGIDGKPEVPTQSASTNRDGQIIDGELTNDMTVSDTPQTTDSNHANKHTENSAHSSGSSSLIEPASKQTAARTGNGLAGLAAHLRHQSKISAAEQATLVERLQGKVDTLQKGLEAKTTAMEELAAQLGRENEFLRSVLIETDFTTRLFSCTDQMQDALTTELRYDNARLNRKLLEQREQYQDFIRKLEARIVTSVQENTGPQGLCSRSEIANLLEIEQRNQKCQQALLKCHRLVQAEH